MKQVLKLEQEIKRSRDSPVGIVTALQLGIEQVSGGGFMKSFFRI
jgi:hypothetical protein